MSHLYHSGHRADTGVPGYSVFPHMQLPVLPLSQTAVRAGPLLYQGQILFPVFHWFP